MLQPLPFKTLCNIQHVDGFVVVCFHSIIIFVSNAISILAMTTYRHPYKQKIKSKNHITTQNQGDGFGKVFIVSDSDIRVVGTKVKGFACVCGDSIFQLYIDRIEFPNMRL